MGRLPSRQWAVGSRKNGWQPPVSGTDGRRLLGFYCLLPAGYCLLSPSSVLRDDLLVLVLGPGGGLGRLHFAGRGVGEHVREDEVVDRLGGRPGRWARGAGQPV